MGQANLTADMAREHIMGVGRDDVVFAPIRHHSPTCSWMLEKMFDEFKPEVIMVEAPNDFEALIPLIQDAETVCPVAILASTGDKLDHKQSHFYPFSETSPEWHAIRLAGERGVDISFIDAPSGFWHKGEVQTNVRNLQDEAWFSSADYIVEACNELGLRDGNALWDHLFETEIGESDWQGYFAKVYAYCWALRASTPQSQLEEEGNLEREAHMRGHIEADKRRKLVLTGGFHTPALLEGKMLLPNKKKFANSQFYLVRYGEAALNQLSGYGAGLRYPNWYARLYKAAVQADARPNWREILFDCLIEFKKECTQTGLRISTIELRELIETAEGLARLRGRNEVFLSEIFDAVQTTLIKGSVSNDHPAFEKLRKTFSGHAIGNVPRKAGLPPLVDDARQRSARARMRTDTSELQKRKLDVRRNEGHHAHSQFFHQMQILGVGYANCLAGPDFVTGYRSEILFEEWEIRWSPHIEGQLVDLSFRGERIPQVAVSMLCTQLDALEAAGNGNDIGAIFNIVLRALQAGLGAQISPILNKLHSALTITRDVTAIVEICSRLQLVDSYDEKQNIALSGLVQVAFDRYIALVTEIKKLSDPEEVRIVVRQMGRMDGVLRGPHGENFRLDLYEEAIERCLKSTLPPFLRSALSAVMVRAGRLPVETISQLLVVNISGKDISGSQQAALEGLILVAPEFLWVHSEILDAANDVIAMLDDESFIAILPEFRRAFAQLDPHQTHRLAEKISQKLSVNVQNVVSGSRLWSEQDTMLALKMEHRLNQTLLQDQLLDWISNA